MNRTGEPSTAGLANRVAGLVRPLVNSEPLTAVLKHLRHEWQSVQAAIFVKCTEDLFLASDFHPITGSKFHGAFPTAIEHCAQREAMKSGRSVDELHSATTLQPLDWHVNAIEIGGDVWSPARDRLVRSPHWTS